MLGKPHLVNPMGKYIYIDKDGNPLRKNTNHVNANVNTRKENQDHQNNSNEMENIML
jgi:hypothetical protein